jgi:hypothetical protein
MNMNMNIAITTNQVTMIMLMCHASRISQPHMSHITSYQCTSTMWFTSSSWRNSQQGQSLTKSTPTPTCGQRRGDTLYIAVFNPYSLSQHPSSQLFLYISGLYTHYIHYYPHYGRKNKTYKVLLVLVLVLLLGEEYTTLCRVVLRPCDSDKSCPVLYFTVLFLTTY